MEYLNKILQGDCLEVLKSLPDNSVDCCVTSPPYFGLRDYGNPEQIGLEETPELFVQKIVNVFAEVKRVLKPTGTLWLNLGDSYAGSGKGAGDTTTDNWKQGSHKGTRDNGINNVKTKTPGIKPKDLIGIPWMVAFALRSNGWYLRQDIIWAKPNPMPESVTDRCTKAHEYIFLLSKSQKYYYDNEAIKTEAINPLDDVRRLKEQSWENKNTPDSLRNGIRPRKSGNIERRNGSERGCPENIGSNVCSSVPLEGMKANKRSVWTVNTMPYSEAHFATFPENLIVDCIKAGCHPQGIVLDPFMGAGTTELVAQKLDRNFIGIELNPAYIAIAENRLVNQLGMFYKKNEKAA